MPSLRRTRHAFFYLEDDYLLDIEAILRAEVPPLAPEGVVVALAILTGGTHRLERHQFDLLLSVPATEWIDAGGLDGEVVSALTQWGLLLSNVEDDWLGRLRERDESLSDAAWDFHAELYHYMTRWSGVTTTEPSVEADLARSQMLIADIVARHGPPPPVFPAKRRGTVIQLPGHRRSGGLYQLLGARRTTRAFDQEVPMTPEQLDAVLLYVFGCHGYARALGGLAYQKRTSPSGGCLHPVAAYPIITNVTGMPAGIYQYCADDHSLVLMSELDRDEAQTICTSFATGQFYFGIAHVSFVLTARFYRNHWKYRRHHKAYAALLMDAAHLSQTLYLVSGELGLGAYITIAINGRDIEQRLGLDGVSEGVIAMLGCGPRCELPSALEPDFSQAPAV